MPISPEKKQEILREIDAGTELPKIATKLAVPYAQVYSVKRRRKTSGGKRGRPPKAFIDKPDSRHSGTIDRANALHTIDLTIQELLKLRVALLSP